VGNVSHQTRKGDIEELFEKYGPIVEITLKSNFAFVEYDDARDAEDAFHKLDGAKLNENRITVEFSHSDRNRRNGNRGGSGGRSSYRKGRNPYSKYSPPRNTEYRLIVEHLPNNCQWRDLKDHFRKIGEVCFVYM